MENSQPLQPTDAQYWTDLGLQYEAIYGQDIGYQNVIQKYLARLPASANILDCGSGTGKPFAKAIVDSGRHVHGIDLSSGMVSLSRKAVPSGTFDVVNMLDYETAVTYDGVVVSLSIFQLSRQETEAMSHKWFQWLKPGGLLLINTVAADDIPVNAQNYDPDGECAQNVEWTFMGKIILNTLFTKGGWKALLDRAGFEIVHTEEDLFEPRAPGVPEPRYYIFAERLLSI